MSEHETDHQIKVKLTKLMKYVQIYNTIPQHGVGCLTHKILIGSQVDCNKGISSNLSTHIVTYTSLLSTSSIEAYKFVKIK